MRRLDHDEAPIPVTGPTTTRACWACCPSMSARPGARRSRWRRRRCGPFDLEAFREGHLTPVFFGSALRNFGVRDLIDALAAFAPPPRSQQADSRMVEANEPA